ncbi:MAG: DnaJ domain-containing protein [Synergistaceae bacterium]|nr:DnaJ domain-containing protein [Synergistaceae bacterium]
MHRDSDYYYRVLGLEPGASRAEVKAVYRHYVKLYHPDRNKMLAAAVVYKEMREAYEALINSTLPDSTGADLKRDSSNWAANSPNASARAGQDDSQAKHTANSAGSNEWNAGHNRSSSNRVEWTSVEWEKWESAFSGIQLENVVIAFMLICLSSGLPLSSKVRTQITPPYVALAFFYHVISWIIFYFLRHFYAPSMWPIFTKFIAGAIYGIVLVILIACCYEVKATNFLVAGVTAAASAWVLMADFDF